jgi:hypothetical protein
MSDLKGKPLNGEKTHPLTAAALEVLRQIGSRGSVALGTLNPGMKDRFERESLIETFSGPTIYPSHKKGTMIEFARLSDAGKVEVAKLVAKTA